MLEHAHTAEVLTHLFLSRGEGVDREAHVSTKDASPRASARFSRANADDRWPQSPCGASRTWTQAPDRRLNQEKCWTPRGCGAPVRWRRVEATVAPRR